MAYFYYILLYFFNISIRIFKMKHAFFFITGKVTMLQVSITTITTVSNIIIVILNSF